MINSLINECCRVVQVQRTCQKSPSWRNWAEFWSWICISCRSMFYLVMNGCEFRWNDFRSVESTSILKGAALKDRHELKIFSPSFLMTKFLDVCDRWTVIWIIHRQKNCWRKFLLCMIDLTLTRFLHLGEQVTKLVTSEMSSMKESMCLSPLRRLGNECLRIWTSDVCWWWPSICL